MANPALVDSSGFARTYGIVTAPAVPASTVTYTNVQGGACLVQVTGGTVTVVQVAGANVGAGDGLYLVPSGATIAVTYSVAPTWTWFVLPT